MTSKRKCDYRDCNESIDEDYYSEDYPKNKDAFCEEHLDEIALRIQEKAKSDK